MAKDTEKKTKSPEKSDESKPRLPKKLVRDIATIAAEVAASKYQEELNKHAVAFKDKRLHNTKLLIRKYSLLRDYTNNAIYDTAQLCSEENNEILSLIGVDLGERHQVGSIRNNVIKTELIMEHIDTMLDCYMRKCHASSKPEVQRRWRVLKRMYLDEKTMDAQEVADLEHIGVSTVYFDIDTACEELSPLFFGLDWTSFWT